MMGDAYPSSVYSGFNPQRFYAETGQTPEQGPGQSTRQRAAAPISSYVMVAVFVAVLWALERRHHGLGFNVGVKSS